MGLHAFVAGVLVVAPSGGNFTDIQSAVNAAAEGDTILVRAGTYQGFDVAAKSLVILADPQNSVGVSTTISVHDLAAGQSFVLSGVLAGSVYGESLRLSNSAGALRFESESVTCAYYATLGHGATVLGCSDVAFFGCSMTGAVPAHQGTPGAGLKIDASRVALHGCTAVGGAGYAGYHMGTGGSSINGSLGGVGCWITQNGQLLAS